MGTGAYHECHHLFFGCHQGEQLDRIARKVTYRGPCRHDQRVLGLVIAFYNVDDLDRRTEGVGHSLGHVDNGFQGVRMVNGSDDLGH
jgi:hypothetical protein